MGLFDRIRNDDEEVELRPPRDASEERPVRSEEGSGSDDDDSDEFLLPGMKPAEDADDTSTGSDRSAGSARSAGSRGSSIDRRDDGIDRIIEQNDRIIELLEDVAETGDDADIWG